MLCVVCVCVCVRVCACACACVRVCACVCCCFEQAQALYDAGEKKWGTDESEFNRIFMTCSMAQLKGEAKQRESVCVGKHVIS